MVDLSLHIGKKVINGGTSIGKIVGIESPNHVLIDFGGFDNFVTYDNSGLRSSGLKGPVELLSMDNIKRQLDVMLVDYAITPEELIAKILEEYCV
jgi:hypothetical protein